MICRDRSCSDSASHIVRFSGGLGIWMAEEGLAPGEGSGGPWCEWHAKECAAFYQDETDDRDYGDTYDPRDDYDDNGDEDTVGWM